MRTARQTAILVVVILKRADASRGRLSDKTFRILADRQSLRAAFVTQVKNELAEFGWIFDELGIGGFGAIRAKSLEAARAITAKAQLTVEERRAIRTDTCDWSALEREALPETDEFVEDVD